MNIPVSFYQLVKRRQKRINSIIILNEFFSILLYRGKNYGF